MRDAATQPALAQRGTAEKQRGRLAAAQRLDRQLDLVVQSRDRASGAPIRGPGRAPSDHDASAGRISVATPPRRASAIAAAASAPTVSGPFDSCTQRETLRATPTMSDASGASSAW